MQKYNECDIFLVKPEIALVAQAVGDVLARLVEHVAVKDACARVTDLMAGRGRVLLRKSGTEPLVRVMVEGDDEAQVRAYAEELAKVVGEVCA